MCKFGGANGHLDRPQRRNLHMGHVPAMHAQQKAQMAVNKASLDWAPAKTGT